MGWLFSKGQTRAELIQRLTKPWSNDGKSAQCLAHSARGDVLWTVWEITRADGSTPRYIGCDLMECEKDYGWGYKDMDESAHPYQYTCPLRFLNMVPVACEEWRQKVREYHAPRLRKLVVGKTYKLVGTSIPEITIECVRPLVGSYGGERYRLSKSLIGDELTEADLATA